MRFASLLVPIFLCMLTGCLPDAILIRPVKIDKPLSESTLPGSKGGYNAAKIALIDVDGVMISGVGGDLQGGKGDPVTLFVEKLDRAAADKKVRAVVIRINSPGGSVAATDSMYHALQQFRQKTGKPVIAMFIEVAASGGYYLACASDGIVAQPGSVTGSIGTIMHTVNFSGTLNKIGVSTVTIKSGQMKDMGSFFRKMGEKERQLFQQIIDEFYAGFVDVVEAGRDELDPYEVRQLADGRVYTAKQALEHGLIDRLGYPDDAIDWAAKLAGIKNPRVIMYHRPYRRPRTVYAASGSEIEPSTSLLGLELPRWLQVQGPQFLYLWSGYVQ